MFKSYLINKLHSKRTLGYRIRTKDTTGVSKIYDGKLLNGVDKSHLDQREIEDILSKQKVVHGDSPWYKEIMNMNPYK